MVTNAIDDAHIELPPRRLLERPKLAALLGVIASEWSALESHMTFLYGTLLGKYVPHDRLNGPPVHPIGFQIFETLPSQHLRKELIQKLAKTLIVDAVLLQELANLMKTLRIASDTRNELVHADWGINNDIYPNELLKIRAPGKFLVYNESHLNEAVDLIIAAGDAVIEFEFHVIKYLRTIPNPT